RVKLLASRMPAIQTGCERSVAIIGDDVLYVEKWPWHHVDDWWNYRNRRRMDGHYAEEIKLVLRDTNNSELVTEVPTMNTMRSVKYGDNSVLGVFTQGTTDEF